MKSRSKVIGIAIAAASLLLVFQNCSKGFQSAQPQGSATQDSSIGTPSPGPGPTTTPTQNACDASSCDLMINAPADFAKIAGNSRVVNSSGVRQRVCLAKDIDFAGETMPALSSNTFDFLDLNGCGHTIANLAVTTQPIFPYLAYSNIHDLNFSGASLNAGAVNTNASYAIPASFGFLAGASDDDSFTNINLSFAQASISASYNTSDFTFNEVNCGLLAGASTNDDVSNVKISSPSSLFANCKNVGGLFGAWSENADGSVCRSPLTTNCMPFMRDGDLTNSMSLSHVQMNVGTLTATNASWVGGVVGGEGASLGVPSTVSVVDVSFTGTVNASSAGISATSAAGNEGGAVGGLFGHMADNYPGNATGLVTSASFNGAISVDGFTQASGIVGSLYQSGNPNFSGLTVSGSITGAPEMGAFLGTAWESGDPIAIPGAQSANAVLIGKTGVIPTLNVGSYNGVVNPLPPAALQAASFCVLNGAPIGMNAGVNRYLTAQAPSGTSCSSNRVGFFCTYDVSTSKTSLMVTNYGSINYADYSPPASVAAATVLGEASIANATNQNVTPTLTGTAPANMVNFVAYLFSQLSPTCTDSGGVLDGGTTYQLLNSSGYHAMDPSN